MVVHHREHGIIASAIDREEVRSVRWLPALLVITAIACFGYALGLVLVPDLMRDLAAATSETAWVRYQLPLYIGLGIISLTAARSPAPARGVVWGIAVVWAGLSAVQVINLATGDEPWTALVVFRLVFDPAMALALGATQRLASTG